MATNFVKKNANKIIHYSDKPLGFTKPWSILLDSIKNDTFDELIMVDGDDQHIFSEIKRIYKKYRGHVVIPEREKRIVFLSDSPINRVAMEDLENAFLRLKYNCKLNDPQTGLFMFLNKNAIDSIKLNGIGSWVGDLAVLSNLYEKKLKIMTPKINVRPQKKATINLDFAFRTVIDLEKFFKINYLDVIKAVKDNSEKYLYKSRLSDVEEIRKLYVAFRNRLKIKKMKGLILSGGYGKRLRPITYNTQKQLIPIANKPIIFYAIEDLINVGIKDIGIIVGPNREQVMKTIGDGSKWGAKITYLQQDSPKGLGHAVQIAKNFIKDNCFVMYLGDVLVRGSIGEFVNKFVNFNIDSSILLTPVKTPQNFGVVKLDKNHRIIKVLEKPKKPPSNLAIAGVYIFRNSIFKALENVSFSKRGELEITHAIQWLIDNGYNVSYDIVKEWWKDTGTPESLLEANEFVLDQMRTSFNKGRIEDNVTITGRVSIDEETIIKNNSVIRGPVIIGKNCVIGPNTYIGPYTSIGNNVKIINSEIGRSIVFDNCCIDSRKRIIDSLIGQNCKITSAKSLPDGYKVVIGDGSIVEI
jgi:glucose-1-phosphate thymidylyltransferase